MDKYGQCPNCKESWDGGDMLETIGAIELLSIKSKTEISYLVSSNYGYTEQNKARFSKVITHNIDGIQLIQCPNTRCSHVFDTEGKEYTSVREAIFNKKEDNL